MDYVGQVYRAEDGLDVRRVVIRSLLEDEHLRVVIHGEGFLGKLVVDSQRAEVRERFEDSDQTKAQVPRERARPGHVVTPDDILIRRAANQLTIVGCGQRVTLRDAGDACPLAVGGDKDVIGLVERGLEARQLIGVVVPVDLKVQVAVVDASVGVVSVQAEGQAHVPFGLVGRRGSAQGQRAAGRCQVQEVGLTFRY